MAAVVQIVESIALVPQINNIAGCWFCLGFLPGRGLEKGENIRWCLFG
jgi:hypothetical protein